MPSPTNWDAPPSKAPVSNHCMILDQLGYLFICSIYLLFLFMKLCCPNHFVTIYIYLLFLFMKSFIVLLLLSSLGQFPSHQALTTGPDSYGSGRLFFALMWCLVAVEMSDELSNAHPPEFNRGNGRSPVNVHLN